LTTLGWKVLFMAITDPEAEKGVGMYLLKRKNVNVFIGFSLFLG